jgi:hypothetical protein
LNDAHRRHLQLLDCNALAVHLNTSATQHGTHLGVSAAPLTNQTPFLKTTGNLTNQTPPPKKPNQTRLLKTNRKQHQRNSTVECNRPQSIKGFKAAHK